MKGLTIPTIYLLILLPGAALSNDVNYYSRHPEFLDDNVIECDAHVRNHAEAFKHEMEVALETYQNNDWGKLQNILTNYDIYKNYRKNPYMSAISDCAGNYLFDSKVNYYRELETEAILFLSGISFDANRKKKTNSNASEHLEYVNHYLDTIINGTNKTANKALNHDAQ